MIANNEGHVRVRATFEGDIDEVCVRVGEVVEEGQRLVVVEGNQTLETLRARRKSEVVEVHVTQDQPVQEHTLLLVLRELVAAE